MIKFFRKIRLFRWDEGNGFPFLYKVFSVFLLLFPRGVKEMENTNSISCVGFLIGMRKTKKLSRLWISFLWTGPFIIRLLRCSEYRCLYLFSFDVYRRTPSFTRTKHQCWFAFVRWYCWSKKRRIYVRVFLHFCVASVLRKNTRQRRQTMYKLGFHYHRYFHNKTAVFVIYVVMLQIMRIHLFVKRNNLLQTLLPLVVEFHIQGTHERNYFKWFLRLQVRGSIKKNPLLPESLFFSICSAHGLSA